MALSDGDRPDVPTWLQVHVTDDFVPAMRELTTAGESDGVPRSDLVRALVMLGMQDPSMREQALKLGAELRDDRHAAANKARQRTHNERRKAS